jgi:hypothetical protein
MEVRFTPEQEKQPARRATKEVAKADARFRAAVREGIAQADQGDFIEDEEMDARLEQMFRP